MSSRRYTIKTASSGRKRSKRYKKHSSKHSSKSQILINTKSIDEILSRCLSQFQPVINNIKTIHNTIKEKVLSGAITLDIKQTEYKQICPSKLDYLKFLLNQENFYEFPIYQRNKAEGKIFSETNRQHIENNNIDELEKLFSKKYRKWFSSSRIMADTTPTYIPIINKNGEEEEAEEELYKESELIEHFKLNKIDHNPLEWTEFVSFQISEEMKTMNNTYNITYEDNKDGIKYVGKITIHSPREISSLELITLLSDIIANILLFNYVLIPSAKIVPNVKIYLCTNQKIMPINEDNVFTGNNINSALTIISNKEILIFRQEELLKVLLHECMHAHNLFNNLTSSVDKYYSVESIQESQSKCETYIETLAEFLNVITKSDIQDSMENLHSNLKKEIIFSVSQVAKILKHVKCTQWDDYCKELIPDLPQEQKKIIETTNLHTYFILKSQCMMELDRFLKLVNLVNLQDIPDTLPIKFDDFLNSMKIKKSYINTINRLINENPNHSNTLRMSIIE